MKLPEKVKKPLKITLSLVLTAALGVGAAFGVKWFKNRNKDEEGEMSTAVVRRGDLVNSITGSGTIEPIEQRDIVPEANGKILAANFKEGDSVKKGDVLYKFEMTTAENAIKTATNSVKKAQTNLSNKSKNIQKARESMEKLKIVAKESGKISDLSLSVGASVPDKICTITNYKEQTATIPFNSAQIDSISIGDTAEVSIDKYMIVTGGTVVRKYTASQTLSNGAVVYNVEIRLDGDYIIEEKVQVTATIQTSSGDVESANYGTVEYAAPVTISPEEKGNVAKVYFKNGDWVNEGELIAELENDDLSDAFETAQQEYNDAKMSLEEAENNLEDKEEDAEKYIVESPISGVVLSSEYSVGDTINGQNAPVMMVIADMSKMKFTISADELDISKIKLGQSVQVTADALEGQDLQGVITNVSLLGEAANGVTNYPIEVTIDKPGELMPGMNVNAEIIVEQADNCLYLPVDAVEYYDGKYYATVVGEMGFAKTGSTQTSDKRANTDKTSTSNSKPRGGFVAPDEVSDTREEKEYEVPKAVNKPQGTENDSEENAGKRDTTPKNESASQSEGASQKSSTGQGAGKNGGPGMADGAARPQVVLSGKEERVEIQVGIVTDESYEIKSGLSEGQVVKSTTRTSSSQNNGFGGFGGMGGGMPGGSNRGGMAGGAARSGAMGGNRMGGGMPGGAR